MINREVNDNSAVSPVVGVILMVAITVILAAVLSQYALGLTDLLKEPMRANVLIDEEQKIVDGDKVVEYNFVLSSKGNNVKQVRVEPDEFYYDGVTKIPVLDNVSDSATITVERNVGVSIVAENNGGRRTVVQRVN